MHKFPVRYYLRWITNQSYPWIPASHKIKWFIYWVIFDSGPGYAKSVSEVFFYSRVFVYMPRRNSGISSNVAWTTHKGSWFIHFFITGLLMLLLIQFFGVNSGLQGTVIIYNVCSFIFFHWLIGDPFTAEYKEFTFWEQMAMQLEESSSLKFMALYPIFLFLFVHRLVTWNKILFCIAFISLLFVVVPKLGFMHMKRVFGIRRYD